LEQTSAAIADLVLVRMTLPSKKPISPSAVRKDVGKLLEPGLSSAEFDELRNELATAGFLSKGPRNTFVLTDAGRDRAMRFLGLAELPAGTNWSTVIAKCLFPKATALLGEAAEKLDSGDKIAALILKRKYGLSAGAGSSVSRVLEALACKQLGFPDETTLDGLVCAVVSNLMGSERLTKKNLVKQLPLFETGLSVAKADAARCKVVRDWLHDEHKDKASSGAASSPQPPESHVAPTPELDPLDLPTFAATVRRLAEDSPPHDRFHDNKVFIAPLWRASQQEPSFPHLSLSEFKQRLVEANSQNLLHLSRADLVQAMDPQLVADSETVYLNATFHFILLEGDHR
jgi:hypothetical protein